MKIDKKNQLQIVIFTALKNRCMLHGHVFVMKSSKIRITDLYRPIEIIYNYDNDCT